MSVAQVSPSGVGEREPLVAFRGRDRAGEDGRWLAEVMELPGVLAYGDTQEAALSRFAGSRSEGHRRAAGTRRGR